MTVLFPILMENFFAQIPGGLKFLRRRNSVEFEPMMKLKAS
jgi:hypothetical protein